MCAKKKSYFLTGISRMRCEKKTTQCNYILLMISDRELNTEIPPQL